MFGAGNTIANFTGQHQDIASGNYDFLLREYNPVQGRWLSPDPAGPAAVNPNDPQSWNRYSYVGNTPLDAVDPLGLCHPDQHGRMTDDEKSSCIENPITVVTDPGNCLVPFNCYIPINPSAPLRNEPWRPWNRGGWDGGGGDGGPAPGLSHTPPRESLLWRPWFKNDCVRSALALGALSIGVDSLGLVPEAGGVARMVGHGAGYRGVVADRVGFKFVNAFGKTATAGQGMVGMFDYSASGMLSTGLIVASFAPGVGQAASFVSIGLDIFKVAKVIGQCD